MSFGRTRVITVTDGTLTVYEFDDPTCTRTVLENAQGYVDTGRGYVVRNERRARDERDRDHRAG